ncbi:hypothetical protein BH24ACT5_BH24ACT5_01110 [soil metagenome]
MIRLSWSQPEDLLPHAFAAAALDGIDVGALRRRWAEATGASEPPVAGASRTPASVGLRNLAVELLDAVDRLNPSDALLVDEPDELRAIELLTPRRGHVDVVEPALDRLHGAWLGRAAGCLLGKPVEKVSRAGIRAIAESTGNWPIATYFTGAGLDPAVAAEHPWNRRSAATSLVENIDGMPEDDDLNFALLALGLVERHGERITTDRVAQAWLDEIPAGRVFTAERVTYRNLLAGWEPDIAGRIGNPFQDWIGAQIRTDLYGWVAPGDPRRAARMAWADARLSHHCSGLYGAMFVAAACSMAVVTASIDVCIDAGLSVVPPQSRYARAIARGVELGLSTLTDEQAIDAIYAEFGHLHWVHTLNNSALVAFALTRGHGNFEQSVTTVVSGGWDTDSNGATVGSLCGALAGASMLPAAWVDPLRNRLSTSVAGFDGIGFDELARRTSSARLAPFDPLAPRPIDEPFDLGSDGAIDVAGADAAKIFGAPDDPPAWPAWRARLTAWRDDARRRLRPDGAGYRKESARWASTCFSVALVWLWDERLFDQQRQVFTPDEFLDGYDDDRRGVGGFDAVVLWQAYPVIGIDERTQFDFYRDVPGLADLIAAFQRRGVRVLMGYNPWDVATGDAERHPALVAALVTDIGVDGVFLDTMSEGGDALRAALEALDPAPVLEGESKVSLDRIADHQMSWAQWMADSPVPGVLRAHWYERRHMMHHTRRWNHDHSDELQSSWMNGAGMLVWENVFGSWVGWNERDRSTLRAMRRVQRALGIVRVDGDWTPLVDVRGDAIAAGVYASRFELGDVTLWTVVNRRCDDFNGAVLDSDSIGDGTGPVSWWDLTSGVALADGDAPVLIPGRGVTGIAAVVGEVPAEIIACVEAAAADSASRGTAFPTRRVVRHHPARSTGVPPVAGITVSAGRRTITFRYRRRETGMYVGAPYVEDWKPLPPRLHDDVADTIDIDLGPVIVAEREVTNAEYQSFLAASGYRPRVAHRFLAGPGRADDDAVTHIDLVDARAFATWAGARLPTEFEWQAAAEQGSTFTRLDPLVWNWTDSEHSDGVTRFVILKGGGAYQAGPSEWYFDGGLLPPSFSAKLLLTGLGVDRSSNIGFRLAWDLAEQGDRQ